MRENYINQKYLITERIEVSKLQYINANPFPHIELIDFFKNGVVKNIMNCFPDLEKTLNYARITKNEKKFDLPVQIFFHYLL